MGYFDSHSAEKYKAENNFNLVGFSISFVF